MIEQLAVVGLGALGSAIVEELSTLDVELLIVDKDPEMVERYSPRVSAAYCIDVLSEGAIQKVIPEFMDAVIVDLGSTTEAAILLTHYLKRHGVRQIIVKADTAQQAEILRLVGATRVVFPDREAAKRIVPMLVSDTLYNYLPISSGMVVAEVHVPSPLVGKTLQEADVRRVHGVNIVAMKNAGTGEYEFVPPEYHFQPGDVLLITGSDDPVARFAGIRMAIRKRHLRDFPARLTS